ncbi:MAG TPA: glycogen/starch synthase [Leptospiraceae bacterium]|nr:glycogen/starch synthase [Leptospiraceae bacterium]HNO21671.1 glycogen/starch synthase [Leptospiraceae bacterium]
MKILHTSAELYPYIKVGGLSDMLASIAKEQANRHEVHIAVPLLKSFRDKIPEVVHTLPAIDPMQAFHSDASSILKKSRFLHTMDKDVHIHFFESPVFENYDKIYSNDGELFNFALFSYACYYLGRLIHADIVHSHDWHTALVNVCNHFLAEGRPTVFTIHNLAYQGDHPYWMTSFLRVDPFNINTEILDNLGKVNYMKGALMFANEITTVSPGYREETLHEPEGYFLSWLLNERRYNYTGILNGIDDRVWNPSFDTKIALNYNSSNAEEGKRENKLSLYKEYGLDIDLDRPLIGMVTRLTHQKGIETFLQSFREKWGLPFYYFILGSGDEKLENTLFHFSHHDHKRLFFFKGFEDALAHKVEAAADFFLMPSLFEPCGLNQMYSQVYGTVPIVSRVGGLKDTVREDADRHYMTGIVFEKGEAHSLNYALDRANTLFWNKADLSIVRRNIMHIDWGWKGSEMRYTHLYEKIRQVRRRAV